MRELILICYYSSSSSSLWIFRYLSSYFAFSVATTLRYSAILTFFKYFLVRYFKYLLEKGTSLCSTIELALLPKIDSSPKLPFFPSTLMRSLRYFSKSLIISTLSSTTLAQSMENFRLTFFWGP